MQHDQAQEQNVGVFSGSILAYESSAEPLSKSNILQEQTIEEKSRTNADIQQ
jgi:hypothetical protein